MIVAAPVEEKRDETDNGDRLNLLAYEALSGLYS